MYKSPYAFELNYTVFCLYVFMHGIAFTSIYTNGMECCMYVCMNTYPGTVNSATGCCFTTDR